MNYRYNYSFLPEFLRRNKISKRDILDAMGTNDYITINRWLSAQSTVGTEMMLRLCNTFGIPLTAFFADMDAPQTMTMPVATADTQTEPEGGYTTSKRTSWNPAPLFTRRVAWTGATEGTTDNAPTLPCQEPDTDNAESLALLRMQAHYEQRINRMEEDHREREREIKAEFTERIKEAKEKNKELVETLKKQVEFLQNLLGKGGGYTGYADAPGFVSGSIERGVPVAKWSGGSGKQSK